MVSWEAPEGFSDSSERVENLDVEKCSTETGIPKSVCFKV